MTVVPRLLHQVARSHDLPPVLADSVAALRAANPNWTYRLWDDDDIAEFVGAWPDPRVRRAYGRIDPAYGAARADLFRYLLLFRTGGVYLDVKSSADRPLDDVVGDAAFLVSGWDNGPEGSHPGWGLHDELAGVPGGELQQWWIAATPGHPLLAAAIDAVVANIEAYRPWRHGIGKPGVLRVTGPVAWTRAVHPLLDAHPHRRVADETELGLVYSVLPGSGHETVQQGHYAWLQHPVVRQPGPVGWAGAGWAGLRRVRSAIRGHA